MSLSGTQFLMSGSYTGSFTATGDITAYSDDSLKTNVQVIDGALGKVEAIRGVTFERIEDGSVSTGVIAQELKAVLPEAVHTDADGVHSVAYGNITGVLIEAIKNGQPGMKVEPPLILYKEKHSLTQEMNDIYGGRAYVTKRFE